jgi:uncharacterized protein YraI
VIPDVPVVPPATSDQAAPVSCLAPTGFNAYVNASSLNFREGPGVQFPIITTLPECSTVQLTGYRNPFDASDPWVQVILPDGQKAWANANYLVMGVPLSQFSVLSD